MFEQIDESLVLKKPKIDRMFQDQEFASFIGTPFRFTGLLNWLALQGAWTFTLFPTTSGGRYYTINIATHEVAYASLAGNSRPSIHMINMDRLIHDFPDVAAWVGRRQGGMADDHYASGLPRSTSVYFAGDFADAREFLSLPGVRRAIIAYWTEGLILLQETGRSSVHAANHNWNAVAEIKKRVAAGTL